MKKLSFSRQILPIIAIVGAIVAGFAIWSTQPDRTITAPERTPPTAPKGQQASVAGTGVIEPASEIIEIGAHLPGVVDQVLVTPGTQVSKGQPLFVIDQRDARAAVAEAEARVASLSRSIATAQTTLANARRQLSLYQQVQDSRAVSEQEVITRDNTVRDAEAQLALVRAQYREAQASLQSARVTLDRHTVRAPISGEILQVEVRPGQYATAGPAPGNSAEPLISMGQTDPLHVRVDIDENDIERLKLGEPAVISPRGNAAVRVKARYVRPEPLVIPKRSLTNASTERVDVRVLQLIFALPADEERFFVGQQVDAFVPGKRSPSAREGAAPGTPKDDAKGSGE